MDRTEDRNEISESWRAQKVTDDRFCVVHSAWPASWLPLPSFFMQSPAIGVFTFHLHWLLIWKFHFKAGIIHHWKEL